MGWSVGVFIVSRGVSALPYLFPPLFLSGQGMVFCLLRPMMGRQKAHLQIRYILAVGYLHEMYLSFIVFDMELECACALDV